MYIYYVILCDVMFIFYVWTKQISSFEGRIKMNLWTYELTNIKKCSLIEVYILKPAYSEYSIVIQSIIIFFVGWPFVISLHFLLFDTSKLLIYQKPVIRITIAFLYPNTIRYYALDLSEIRSELLKKWWVFWRSVYSNVKPLSLSLSLAGGNRNIISLWFVILEYEYLLFIVGSSSFVSMIREFNYIVLAQTIEWHFIL